MHGRKNIKKVVYLFDPLFVCGLFYDAVYLGLCVLLNVLLNDDVSV